MTNPRGRPVKYDEVETLNLCEEYLSECGYHITKTEIPVKTKVKNEDGEWELKDTVEIKIKERNILPTIEGLALKLKINKTTIYEWESSYPDFSNYVSELRAMQANMLIQHGLSNEYSPMIAKVLLTKHGYREGIEQSGKDGIPLVGGNLTEEEKTNLLNLLKDNPHANTSA